MSPTTPPRAVFLVGFMGAGKTTVGKALAQRLGRRFLDLDDLITSREGRGVPQIFEESGEAHFRQAETAALRELLHSVPASDPVVVALGGGAIVREENAHLLREAGFPVVLLDAGINELLRRCRSSGDARPLAREGNRFRQLFQQRRMRYMAVELRIDTEGKSVDQVASEIVGLLGFAGRQEAR